MTYYAQVTNGEITRLNLSLPFATETTSFGINATPEELAEHGFFPIVGDEPEYDRETLRLVGPSYAVEFDQVRRVYDVEPIPQEEILAKAKATREAAVAAIKVTTQAGHTFDGDETSQGRMARAIIALSAAGGTVDWVLADNSIAAVTAAELTEALALAGAAQAAIWVSPYATPAA